MEEYTKSETAFTRRKFVKGAALSALGFIIVPRHVLGGPGYTPPSDKVNIGIIGAGGKGRENAISLMELDDVQISSVADPAYYWNLAEFYYKSEAGRGPVKAIIEEHNRATGSDKKVKEYDDFRKMLEDDPSLDAVVCSTPDHTHAYISILSMRAGKHIYCEKPLTHNIWEARKVLEVAKETSLATQMGNIGHSTEGIRQTVEFLRSGAIGKVREAHAWVPATRWNTVLTGYPTGPSVVPIGFEWDLWLGPAQERPYHEAYTPVNWRDFWAFGCGALGDFGCHDLDAATWAFELQDPETVQIFPAGFSNEDVTPFGEIGYYNFQAKGKQQPLRLTWYSGGLRPQHHEILPKDYAFTSRGTMFVGDKGILINEGTNRIPKLFPDHLNSSVKQPKPFLTRSNGHFRDWIDAIKGGPAASANFEYGARLTELTLLGVLSLRMGGKKIQWDSKNMKAIGLPEADAFIKEPVRPGWEIV